MTVQSVRNSVDTLEHDALVQPSALVDLPIELILQILMEVPRVRDILACSQTCKDLHASIKRDPEASQYFWKYLYERDFSPDPTYSNDFREDYKIRHTVQTNLTQGVCNQYDLHWHEITITSIAYAEGKLISSSWDATIKVWDLTKNKCLYTLNGHEECISTVICAKDKLISGSKDRKIRIWDFKTGDCIHTSKVLRARVASLIQVEGKFISGSSKGSIIIWDLNTYKRLHRLQAHTSIINSLVFANGKLISGSCDQTIKIWDIEQRECVHTLQAHDAEVTSLIFAQGKLISSSCDKTIKIWDLETYECLHAIQSREGVMRLALAEDRLFAGLADGQIEIWDLETTTCLHTLQVHRSSITSLCFADGRLFSSATSSWFVNVPIKVCDFNCRPAPTSSWLSSLWNYTLSFYKS